MPDDETLPEDLRRRFTYVIEVIPTKKGNEWHKIENGSGEIMLIQGRVNAKHLKAREGKLVRLETRPGDMWGAAQMKVVTGFDDAPAPEERRRELFQIVIDALQGRKDVSSLDDVAFDDPIVPGFAGTLPDPGKIIGWVREQEWPCPDDRLSSVFDHLGMHDVEIPEAVPEPGTDPEPEAALESRVTLEEMRATVAQVPLDEVSNETEQEPVYELLNPVRPGHPVSRGTKGELQEFLRRDLSFTAKEASRIVRTRAVLVSDSDTATEVAE